MAAYKDLFTECFEFYMQV